MAFIVFEGLDGSGKSTQIRLLHEFLSRQGHSVLLTREPGGTPLGEEIRRLLLRVGEDSPSPRCELLLYAGARAQHVEKVIQPALTCGQWVLCDRFTGSTVAFQEAGRGLARRDIEWLNAFATQQVSPDLVILLDLPVPISVSRRQQRYRTENSQADRFEIEHLAFHQKVRESYLEQARQFPHIWLTVDAVLEPEVIANLILTKMRERGWLAS